MAIEPSCTGIYVFNDDQVLTRPCPIRGECFRYIEYLDGHVKREVMPGPYDDETSTCEKLIRV